MALPNDKKTTTSKYKIERSLIFIWKKNARVYNKHKKRENFAFAFFMNNKT